MLVRWCTVYRNKKLEYGFSGDVITATLEGKSDTFDFSGFPDGAAIRIDSHLNPCPVLSAKRVNGRLEVTLLKYIKEGDERFPPPELIEEDGSD